MIKCPYCHFDNEDGSQFCERCTSGLEDVAPVKAAAPPPLSATPVAPAMAIADVTKSRLSNASS